MLFISLLRRIWNAYVRVIHERSDRKEIYQLTDLMERGKSIGFFMAGRMFEEGNSVIEKDRVKAMAFYLLAKQKGEEGAHQAIEKLASHLSFEEREEAQNRVDEYYRRKVTVKKTKL